MPRPLLIRDEGLVAALRHAGYCVESVQAEEPRYTIDVSDGWNGLIDLPGGSVAIRAGERLVYREQVLITDPAEQARVKEELAQMRRIWLSLSDFPGGDTYDASELVEEIVLAYESLGEYRAADTYRAMIVREKTHDWGENDDVLVFSSDTQGTLRIGRVPFSEAFDVPASPSESERDTPKGDQTTERDDANTLAEGDVKDPAISEEDDS